MGFNLIEIMIVIVILGIVSGLGGFYFISLWREHRISVQNNFLQREAQYALDYIINGQMEEREADIYYRYDGIISSHGFKIYESSADKKVEVTKGEGNEIWLYNENGLLVGRIYTDPIDNPLSLLFDEDEDKNGNEHMIIPTGVSEAGIEDTYTIEINFSEDSSIPSLINIEILLDQNVYTRKISVNMKSRVKLRN